MVEGWTFQQWRARLDRHPDLRHDTQGLSEAQIIERLGLGLASLEGQLFPDTYLFDKQSSDLDLLATRPSCLATQTGCRVEPAG